MLIVVCICVIYLLCASHQVRQEQPHERDHHADQQVVHHHQVLHLPLPVPEESKERQLTALVPVYHPGWRGPGRGG